MFTAVPFLLEYVEISAVSAVAGHGYAVGTSKVLLLEC